jgi:hypothetical protein
LPDFLSLGSFRRGVAAQPESHAQPGADGYRKSPQVKHTPVSVEPGPRQTRWPVVPEVAVIIILDDTSPHGLSPSQEAQTAFYLAPETFSTSSPTSIRLAVQRRLPGDATGRSWCHLAFLEEQIELSEERPSLNSPAHPKYAAPTWLRTAPGACDEASGRARRTASIAHERVVGR